MPERELPESPTAFLARHGVPGTLLNAFRSPSDARVVEVRFEEFIRGAGGANDPAGCWWARRRDIEKLEQAVRKEPVRDGERRDLLKRVIRDQTAVALNWNSMSAFWGMVVEGNPLQAIRGPARAQPVWDPSSGKTAPASLGNATERMLPGGIVQYWFPVVPTSQVRYFGASRGRRF